MPSIDHLIGHTATQLAAMTDEEILAKYADCFKLEPVVLKKEVVAQPTPEGEEAEEPATPKVKKPRKNKQTEALQESLLNMAKMQEMLSEMKKAKEMQKGLLDLTPATGK